MSVLHHHKRTVIGVIIGIAMTLLAALYADFIRQLNTLEQNECDSLSYQYQYAFSIQTMNPQDYTKISSALKEAPITIIAEPVGLYADDCFAEHACAVVFSQSEGLKEHLISGHYPTEEELATGEPVVILGNALRDVTYQKNNEDYFLICGEEYRVIGYCSGIHTTISNYNILLFADCLADQTRQDFWRSGDTYTQTFLMLSDRFLPKDFYLTLKSELESFGIKVEGFVETERIIGGSQYHQENMQLSYLLSGFSIFVTLMIIQYWLYQRRYEFAIRRIYGYSKRKIYICVAKDLWILLIGSMMAAYVVYSIIVLLYYFFYGIHLPYLYGSMVRSLIQVVVIFLIFLFGTVWNVFRQIPAATYKGE